MDVEKIVSILKKIPDPIDDYENDVHLGTEAKAIYDAFSVHLPAIVRQGMEKPELAQGMVYRLRAAADARGDIDWRPLFGQASTFGKRHGMYLHGLALKHTADWKAEIQRFWFPEEEPTKEQAKRQRSRSELRKYYVHQDRDLRGRRLLVVGDVRNNANRLRIRLNADDVEIVDGHDYNAVKRAMRARQDIVVVQIRYSDHVDGGMSVGDYRVWDDANTVIASYSPGSGVSSIALAITENTSERGFCRGGS